MVIGWKLHNLGHENQFTDSCHKTCLLVSDHRVQITNCRLLKLEIFLGIRAPMTDSWPHSLRVGFKAVWHLDVLAKARIGAVWDVCVLKEWQQRKAKHPKDWRAQSTSSLKVYHHMFAQGHTSSICLESSNVSAKNTFAKTVLARSTDLCSHKKARFEQDLCSQTRYFYTQLWLEKHLPERKGQCTENDGEWNADLPLKVWKKGLAHV